MAGDQEQVAGRDDLVLGELVAGLLYVDQPRHQIVTRIGAAPGDQVPQIIAQPEPGLQSALEAVGRFTGKADERIERLGKQRRGPAELGLVTPTGAGRFAPSPSADLHIGNLRTAMLAWLFARSTGRRFLMRVDDLDDRTHTDIASRQLDDLAAIGLTWDGPVEWQTAHPQRYDDAVDVLAERGLLYECYCSRRDIQQAPHAPHAPQDAYPGTCRDLADAERTVRREETGRPPALRLRTDAIVHTVHDLLHGEHTGIVDDFVVRRGDSVAAYNHAVVVDDAAQGIDQVVRRRPAGVVAPPGLPRQTAGLPGADICARPLVLNEDGARLAKRDGAVTLAEISMPRALEQIGESLGFGAKTLDGMLEEFDPNRLPRDPWVYQP